MSNEFNLMLSQDLTEVSGPIEEMLIEKGHYNKRGVAALLQLASCMIAEAVDKAPSKKDHELAQEAFKAMGANPMALVSFIASLAKGLVMAYYGYGKDTHGSVQEK